MHSHAYIYRRLMVVDDEPVGLCHCIVISKLRNRKCVLSVNSRLLRYDYERERS